MTAHDPPNTSRTLARHSCQLYKQSSCQHGCNIPTRWVSGRRITANPTPPPCRTKPDPAASTFPCQHSKPPQAMPSTRHRPSLPHFDTLGRTLSLHCRHVRSPAIHATHRAIVPSVGTRLKPPITRNHSRRRIHVPGATRAACWTCRQRVATLRPTRGSMKNVRRSLAATMAAIRLLSNRSVEPSVALFPATFDLRPCRG